jgi:hypothetical protein
MRLTRVRFSVRSLMVLIAICAGLFGGVAWAIRTRSGQYFCWLGSQSIGVAAYFFPIFSWVAWAGLGTAVMVAARSPRFWRPRSALVLLPFFIPVVILGYGVAFEWHSTPRSPVERRLTEMTVFFWSHGPLALILSGVFRRHWHWVVVIGLSLFSAWLAIGASVMSSMSITNTWL